MWLWAPDEIVSWDLHQIVSAGGGRRGETEWQEGGGRGKGRGGEGGESRRGAREAGNKCACVHTQLTQESHLGNET